VAPAMACGEGRPRGVREVATAAPVMARARPWRGAAAAATEEGRGGPWGARRGSLPWRRRTWVEEVEEG
jgi:hypothetical protein